MKILISILNWNKAAQTLECVKSLAGECAVGEVTILVIDNGSRADDVELLKNRAPAGGFELKCLPMNTGFTGGHNVAIKMAFDEGYDFIWLVNNDAIIAPGALLLLVDAMAKDESCGAASPVIRNMERPEQVISCLNTHDWQLRTYTEFTDLERAKRVQAERPKEVYLYGTGIFFRIQALKEVGLLDDRLFAYYDDDEIGCRLAAAGWKSKCVFEASILHEHAKITKRPPHFYYLMQRNRMLFWYENTPKPYRKLLWLKVVDAGLFDVVRLYRKGLVKEADIALLGVHDFITRRFGAPNLDRRAPFFIKYLFKLSAWVNRKKFAQTPLVSEV